MCFIKVPDDIEEILRKPDAEWTVVDHARVQAWIDEAPKFHRPYYDLRELLYRQVKWELPERLRVMNWLNKPPQFEMMVRFNADWLYPQGNYQDAEDVTQDFFVPKDITKDGAKSRYASVVQNFDPTHGCFCGYFRTALKNFCFERKRNTDWLLREPRKCSKGDILTPHALAKKLAQAPDYSVKKTVSSFIRWKWSVLVADPKNQHKKLPDLVKELEMIQRSECASSEDDLHKLLAYGLNVIIKGGTIYDEETFENIPLRPRTKCMVRSNEEPREINRRLIEDAYPEDIRKAPSDHGQRPVVQSIYAQNAQGEAQVDQIADTGVLTNPTAVLEEIEENDKRELKEEKERRCAIVCTRRQLFKDRLVIIAHHVRGKPYKQISDELREAPKLHQTAGALKTRLCRARHKVVACANKCSNA